MLPATRIMPSAIRPARTEPLTFRRLFAKLGPGLITGASDDDPSGIGTYSQIGAQFGYILEPGQPARPRLFGKKSITPKSSNQRRYMESIEHHDMVFAIGPGGT